MFEQRALASQEREQFLSRLRSWSFNLILVTATLLTFLAIFLFATDRIFAPDKFQIQELKISGKFRNLSPEKIESIVLREPLGNFFSINVASLRTTLEKEPWIALARVRRHWPDQLSVSIVEHQPVARWQDVQPQTDQPQSLWLSADAKVIDVAFADAKIGELTLVGSRKHAKSILENAEYWSKLVKGRQLEIRQVNRSASGAWRLRLNENTNANEFNLYLGQIEPHARLRRFVDLYESKFRFSERRLSRVDARYPNGVAVKLKATSEATSLLINDEPISHLARVIQP